jgi:hypothetical protein
MKVLTITTIAVILAAAFIIPSINTAFASNTVQIKTVEDGRYQLSPKAFGPNTVLYMCDNSKCFDVDKTQNGSFDGIKKEEIKAYKKAIALHNAIKFMKSYYKTGF